MSRYTKNNLKSDLQELNDKLESKGLDFSFKYQSRNNYHAVDLMDSNGCLRCVDCHEPPRILYAMAQDCYFDLIKNND